MDIGILGAGTWGNALANLLSGKEGYEVSVWSALPDEVDYLNEHREHYNLPGVKLGVNITFEKDLKKACTGKDLIVFATPSQFIRSTARQVKGLLPKGQVCVTVAKGIEKDTFEVMSQIIEDELEAIEPRVVALTGPTHAEEVARGMVSTIVAASADTEAATFVQETFSTPWMRVYTSSDPVGAEICGALKNIIALASGIATGLGYGDNAHAALITRGLDEMMRLGVAAGCRRETFYGLEGMGDLIVTCLSQHSRNNHAGRLIGQGKTAQEACEEVGMVVEGLNALPAAMALGAKHGVELPIISAVNDVVEGRLAPANAISHLYSRPLKAE